MYQKFTGKLIQLYDLLLNNNGLFLLAYTLVLITAGYIFSTTMFSTDSWSYYELSNTVFNEKFYEPNTIRNYLGYIKSSSFPFGYPVFLAIMHWLILDSPMIAVYSNIAVAIFTTVIIYKLALHQKLNKDIASYISISMLIFPPYVEEILSGRSVPLATLLFLCSIYLLIKYRYLFLSGVIIGLSVITRFDYLVLSIALLTYSITLKISFYKKLGIFCGFMLGVTPWIIFSIKHFGVLWASDNSWVSAASYLAYVRDYPAFTDHTIYSEPLTWLLKIIKNLWSLCYNVIDVSRYYLTFLATIILVAYYAFKNQIKFVLIDYIIMSLVCVSLLPYVLTGYYDGRYFSTFFLIGSLLLLVKLNGFNPKITSMIIFLAVATNTISTYKYYKRTYHLSIERSATLSADYQRISELRKEHALEPDITYVFTSIDDNTFAAKYGAISGTKTTFYPKNYRTMSAKEKESFFTFIGPHKLIEYR